MTDFSTHSLTTVGHGRPAASMIEAIGNTPLIRLREASEATGCDIYGKAEFMNPGGSVKDRAALAIIEDAFKRGLLKEGGTVVEGTAGNTGIGLTLVAQAMGCKAVIVVPETQSKEKLDFLRMIGADLRLVPAKPYRDPGNYVHVSRRLAEETGGFWANQFDNTANREGHRHSTAPEIWSQLDGKIDAFTCSCGTGGTLAGIALGLRDQATQSGVKAPEIVLADPEGSGLYGWVTQNDLSVSGGSITEGIGQSRVTANLDGSAPDHAERIPDAEALKHVFNLTAHEGLSVGGSSGINIASAVRTARRLGPGHRIVTILCDGGARYQSKLFNTEFLKGKGLPTPPWL
ncbi:cysteine synthase A [Saccharibacter floricola]